MRIVIAVALLLAAVPGLSAQSPVPEPEPGERVYAVTGGRRIEGTLVSLDDSLVIETGSGESVVRGRPTVIFRHAGHVPAGRGFLRGAGIGALVGFGAGALIGFADGDDEGTFIAFSKEEKALIGGATLGAIGLVAGGIFGAATSGDRWERVPLQPRVGVSGTGSGGRLVLGIVARF